MKHLDGLLAGLLVLASAGFGLLVRERRPEAQTSGLACPCVRSNPKSCSCAPGLCQCDDLCFCPNPGPRCKVAVKCCE